ncbi:MAG TPA: branched-chain amino acid ABC transporter permease [Candidatus Micrarchaeia archaeon]|nr:branched-chain amino acid ABC transporter permease [Candidatus Micrarchaeia archaeon]
MQLVPEAIVFGLVSACVLAIATVGFSLQVGVTNVLNFAYGSTMTVCAFVAYLCNRAGVPIWLAVCVAGGFGAIFSLLLNRGVFRPFDRHGTGVHSAIYVSIGLGLILQYAVDGIWGPDFYVYRQDIGNPVHILGVVVTTTQLVIVGIALGALLATHLLLARTRLGTAMRATAANRQLARTCGIDTDAVADAAWMLSGVLCGVAGVVLAITIFAFTFELGDQFIIVIFAAAVLGGLGQPYGAMLGAVVIGVTSEVAAALIQPEFKEVVAFAILVAVLVIRPQGILGEFVGRRGMVR